MPYLEIIEMIITGIPSMEKTIIVLSKCKIET